MPELPEVETIKRELEKAVVGKTIAEVLIYNPAVIREPKAQDFKRKLIGAKISRLIRKAKVLVFEFANGKSLAVHLKMTGQLIFPGQGQGSRVSFRFSDGNFLDFNDQRLFGELRYLDDWRSLSFIQGLGPEPFEITPGEFSKMLSKKRTKIKPLLMDQKFIAGIGNLYAAEVLFRARINPERSANSLSNKEKDALFKSIIKVLNAAIKHGGSSVDDYVRLSGQPGDYAKYHQVYGRENQPCFNCKNPIKRIVLGGRGTYFCSRCQR